MMREMDKNFELKKYIKKIADWPTNRIRWSITFENHPSMSFFILSLDRNSACLIIEIKEYSLFSLIQQFEYLKKNRV